MIKICNFRGALTDNLTTSRSTKWQGLESVPFARSPLWMVGLLNNQTKREYNGVWIGRHPKRWWKRYPKSQHVYCLSVGSDIWKNHQIIWTLNIFRNCLKPSVFECLAVMRYVSGNMPWQEKTIHKSDHRKQLLNPSGQTWIWSQTRLWWCIDDVHGVCTVDLSDSRTACHIHIFCATIRFWELWLRPTGCYDSDVLRIVRNILVGGYHFRLLGLLRAAEYVLQ